MDHRFLPDLQAQAVRNGRRLSGRSPRQTAGKGKRAAFIRKDCGVLVNPDSLFDTSQTDPRVQAAAAQRTDIVLLYNDLKNHGPLTKDMEPFTFFFGGKAAPDTQRKLIIKLINNIAKTVNEDPRPTTSSGYSSCPTIGHHGRTYHSGEQSFEQISPPARKLPVRAT
jgi:hypothetical protein